MCFRPHIRLHRPPTPPAPENAPILNLQLPLLTSLSTHQNFTRSRSRSFLVPVPAPSEGVEKKSTPPQARKEPRAGCEQYSQFTLFPKLPPEVRARIWYFAVQSPRVMEVHETHLIVFNTNRPTSSIKTSTEKS
jgi:hypothetical protein